MKKIIGILGFIFLFCNVQMLNGQNITGGGTSNYIPVFSSASSIANSIMYYNKTNASIGISTENPLAKLHIDGNLQIGRGLFKACIGSATGSALGYGTSYLGFNARRNSDNTWIFDSDGANNGGSIFYGTVSGSMFFTPVISTSGIVPPSGNTFQIKSDEELYNAKSITFSSDCNIGIRTRHPKAGLHIVMDTYGWTAPALMVTSPCAEGGTFNPVIVDEYSTYIHQLGNPKDLTSDITNSSLIVNGRLTIWSGETSKPDIREYVSINAEGFRYGSAIKAQFTQVSGEKIPIITGGIEIMDIKNNLKSKITSDGKIWAQEIRVQLADPWPDFVFEKDYKLRSISELDNYIKNNKHLPEIPSSSEVAEAGIDLASMNAKLLQKIEELHLYIIELNNRINELNQVKK